MSRTTTSLRVDDELLAWSRAYAAERRVSWAAVVEAALRGLRQDVAGGVPELEEASGGAPPPEGPGDQLTPDRTPSPASPRAPEEAHDAVLDRIARANDVDTRSDFERLRDQVVYGEGGKP